VSHGAGAIRRRPLLSGAALMRVAIIVVAVSLASLPALASPSCMTQSEARQKFPNSHLWWHGPNRCWDATPPSRQRLAQRIKKESRQDSRAERDAADEKQPEAKSKPVASQTPRWREAMSRMRPDDMLERRAPARASASAEAVNTPAPPHVNFWDRWVEIAQRAPPIVDKAGPADLAADASHTEPIVTPIRVMLALLVLLLALGAFELLSRRTEWRR
jgi:hypothetical protein